MRYEKLIIHTDGGARGNPGPAGIGITLTPAFPLPKGEGTSPAILRDEGEIQIAEYIGEATNNQAEYKAVIRAMEEARKLNASELEFYLDSELVVKQLNREYKVKNKELAPLFMKVYNLSQGFRKVTFKHIIRERNKEADALVNKAIDGR